MSEVDVDRSVALLDQALTGVEVGEVGDEAIARHAGW